MKKKISIIIPFYNERENIPVIVEELKKKVLFNTKYDFEIIMMDNNSTDGSGAIAKRQSQILKNIKYFKMSRNFGYQANIKAGYELCTGDAAVQLDADGEDDPKIILEFIKYWEKGYDVVYGIRKKRNESSVLSFTRNLFYKFLFKFSDIKIPERAGDFRLIDRKVIDYLNSIQEQNLYIRGLISFIGFSQIGYEYDRNSRKIGKSKISLLKYFNIAMSAITSFTKTPLSLIFFVGLFLFLTSLFLILIYLVIFSLGSISQPGFTTLILIQLFFFGLTMFILGIISIYVGYILDEVKKRPTYILDDEDKE